MGEMRNCSWASQCASAAPPCLLAPPGLISSAIPTSSAPHTHPYSHSSRHTRSQVSGGRREQHVESPTHPGLQTLGRLLESHQPHAARGVDLDNRVRGVAHHATRFGTVGGNVEFQYAEQAMGPGDSACEQIAQAVLADGGAALGAKPLDRLHHVGMVPRNDIKSAIR